MLCRQILHILNLQWWASEHRLILACVGSEKNIFVLVVFYDNAGKMYMIWLEENIVDLFFQLCNTIFIFNPLLCSDLKFFVAVAIQIFGLTSLLVYGI